MLSGASERLDRLESKAGVAGVEGRGLEPSPEGTLPLSFLGGRTLLLLSSSSSDLSYTYLSYSYPSYI